MPNERSITTRVPVAVRPETRHAVERCEQCGETMAAIDFIVDGEAFAMRSCAACDRRVWTREGADVDVGTVLGDLVSSRMRYRRDYAIR